MYEPLVVLHMNGDVVCFDLTIIELVTVERKTATTTTVYAVPIVKSHGSVKVTFVQSLVLVSLVSDIDAVFS